MFVGFSKFVGKREMEKIHKKGKKKKKVQIDDNLFSLLFQTNFIYFKLSI